MSDSDEIKRLLNLIYGKADWKRRSKTVLSDGIVKREFREPNSGMVLPTYTNPHELFREKHAIFNGRVIQYGIVLDEWDQIVVHFIEPFYKRNSLHNPMTYRIMLDQNMAVPAYLEMATNGVYYVERNTKHLTQIQMDLAAAGFIENQAYSAELANVMNTCEARNMVEWLDWTISPIIFGIWDAGANPKVGGLGVMFSTHYEYYELDQVNDQHVSYLIQASGRTLPAYLDEAMENSFAVWESWMHGVDEYPKYVTRQLLISDLQSAGFIFDAQMDQSVGYP